MPPPAPLHRSTLHEGWTLQLREAGEDAPDDLVVDGLPASVPGVVHTDLLRAGLLADPDVGTAEADQHWIGRSAWSYRTTVTWSDQDHERTELVFEGLDTLAEVRLGGELLGTTRNMHRTHRFDVTDRIQEGDNDLEVVFLPIRDEVDRVRDLVGELPATEAIHYPYVRKMACNFGWDWGPILVTAGIWRPVALEAWSTARLRDVRPLVDVDGTTGRLEVRAAVERTGDAALQLRVRVGDAAVEVPVATEEVRAVVEIDDVERWWPIGFGPQPMYDVTVELVADGGVVDRAQRRVGFRTVEVDETPDEVGTRWAIVVNGTRVPVRGFNWIPDDPFPTEVDRDRYARRIDQAVGANANLLRVWGGGIFERADFYELCDERGLLVWQDFLFACAAYPETEEYRDEVAAESRQAIVERAHHPSLVLWCGNNECIWGFHDWGWPEILDGRPWGAGYYGDLLPELVSELDPTRPYLVGSPSSGDVLTDPNSDAQGVSHIWNVWNDEDYLHYRDRAPAFVAEMGFCGPPAWATLRRAVPAGELTLDDPVVQHHERALDGPGKHARRYAEHFPPVEHDDDWHWLAQLNQARALSLGIDHLRALARCSGAVVWQLNDCWPVVSWAAIDGDERRKPLWYALREAFTPRRAFVQPDLGGLVLVAVNDRPGPWLASVTARRVRFDGTVLAETKFDLAAPAVGTARRMLGEDLAVPEDPLREVLIVETNGSRTTWFWAGDRELAYPRAAWDAEVVADPDGLRLRITARTFVRDLAVFPDRLEVDGAPLGPDAVASEMLLTLLPGETREIEVRGARPEHAGAIVRRPVMRAVNDVAALAGPT
jgi:beta-mannosidase